MAIHGARGRVKSMGTRTQAAMLTGMVNQDRSLKLGMRRSPAKSLDDRQLLGQMFSGIGGGDPNAARVTLRK